MTKQNFMQGTLILFFSGVFVKIFGFVFQVLVIRFIGTEAVGLYNMIFPLYITALVLATSGLPLAISKMIAEEAARNNFYNALKIFKISLYLLILLGFVFTILIIFIAPIILNSLYADQRVTWCFYAMLPGIIIVPICSAFRGFFQGLQEMIPPAIAQCVEQIIRISLGLFLIIKLEPYGIKISAVGLSVSMITGEIVGLFVIYLLYILKKHNLKKELANYAHTYTLSVRKIISDLFAFGFPTTLTRLTSSFALTLEASLIPIALQKSGYTIIQATRIYGQFSGVALTLLTIPTVLTFSLATSLVPAISEAETQGKLSALQFRSTEALRLTYVLGLPVTVALLLKASGLCSLLFNLPEAGTSLRYLSCGAIFLYLAQTSNGILQGLGLVKRVLINTIIGAVIKLIGIVYLVSNSELNINGAALAYIIYFIIVCTLDLHAIYSATGFHLTISQIILPFAASIIMGGIIIWQTQILTPFYSNKIVTVISLALGSIIYLILNLLWGQLNIGYILKKKKG